MSSLGRTELVQDLIARMQTSEHGAIPFQDFMELCLYHEEYGYYRTTRPKIGKDGDFYTSSSVGTIMGEMLAAFAAREAEAWRPAADGSETLTIVEFGGGSGRLAVQLLDALRARSPAAYAAVRLVMIETSPYHRELQRQSLSSHSDKVGWQTENEWLGAGAVQNVIVIANELLDAFPVHLLEADEKGEAQEIYVGWNEIEGRFAESKLPLSGDSLGAYLEREGIRLQPGQRIEVNFAAPVWIQLVCSRIRSGRLVLIDYGDVAGELYAPHRMRGTLLAYRRHEATERIYENIGEQDLTAHVNFSDCRRAALAAGCDSAELMTQRDFLLQNGVLQLLQDAFGADPFGPVAKRNRAVRQLLLDGGLSQVFKVLLLSKA